MDKPRNRNRWLIILSVMIPCVAIVSCFGGGMVVAAFNSFADGLHPDADVDALLALIDSGKLAIGSPTEIIWAGGHPCAGWGPFQSGGHEFGATVFHNDGRSITIYSMDQKIIAAQGRGIPGEYPSGDKWFFIDLDKFNAYIDANTGGRFTRSDPLIDPAPAN